MDEITKSPLTVLALSLETFIDQLKENQAETNGFKSDFDKEEFNRQISALMDTISHECTRFAMIFTDGNALSAKTVDTMCNRLIGMSAALYKTTANLPAIVVGVNYQKSIREAVVDVFRTIVALTNAAKEDSSNLKAQLKETGTVWEACDRLKGMPKDSRELLLRRISETLGLVNDAFVEIQELNAETSSSTDTTTTGDDDEESRTLTDREKIQLKACVQLIKAMKATLSKTSAAIEQRKVNAVSTVASDDELTSLVLRISPLVDNIVSSFYEAQLDPGLDQEVSELCDLVNGILTAFSGTPYSEDVHFKWANIIRTAVEHNFSIYRGGEHESGISK